MPCVSQKYWPPKFKYSMHAYEGVLLLLIFEGIVKELSAVTNENFPVVLSFYQNPSIAL